MQCIFIKQHFQEGDIGYWLCDQESRYSKIHDIIYRIWTEVRALYVEIYGYLASITPSIL